MKRLILIGAFIVSLLGAGFVSAAEIKVGVMAPRGALKAMKRWGDLGGYLTNEVGSTVKIVPLKPGETVDAVATGSVDYMLSNPVLAVALKHKLGAETLATMNKKSGNQFAGVIFAKKGNGVTTVAGLKGKKVMAFKFKRSAAAYVFQVKHLKDKGINPHKDFAVFKEAKKQDDIVLAVKSGIFDAGFVKSGLLESMAKENKVSLSDFTIIDKQSDSLSKVHSTVLYPEWCMSASKSANAADKAKIKAALLKMTASTPASKKAKIVGFVDALSLDGLSETLKSLKLPPFNQ